MILATSSEIDVIAGATKTLINLGWPNYLATYKNYYLQNVPYVDSTPGISWYIVVLLPANIQADYIGPESNLYAAVIAIATVSIVIELFGVSVTIWFMNARLIRLTRPFFTLVVMLGSLLLSIYCILLLGRNTDSACTVRPWLFNLAFTLAFSPLLIKSYMVHRLFNVNAYGKNKIINYKVLIIYTLLFLLLDTCILATTLYGKDGTKEIVATQATSSGAYGTVSYCSSTRNSAFLYAEISFKGLMIGAACVLSFLVRKIPGTIAGSKMLVITVYNVACVSVVVMLIIHTVTDIGIMIMCQVVGICLSVVVTTILLVFPTFMQLLTEGDDAAADEVIGDIFSGKRDSVSNEKRGSSLARPTSMKRNSAVSAAPNNESVVRAFAQDDAKDGQY